MREPRNVLTALLIAALALAPAAASAATIGAEVFGAYNTYAMDDVNDAIDADNDAGADFDEFGSGPTGGLGLRLWPNASWMLSAAWEPLFLETESDATESTWNMDANSFQFTAGYFFPSTTGARYGLGAGVGYYSVAGENTDPALIPETIEIEGSGVGFHVLGMGEWRMSPGFSVTAGAGYRFADIEIDESTTDATADYSGFMGRLGLAFYLPSGGY